MEIITAEHIHTYSDKLEIVLFNVGQGDHILLKFPTGEYGIIDFYYDAADMVVEPPCLSYFKELQRVLPKSEFEKITISFFCISHTDKDHVKGISETIEWFHNNSVFIRDFWLSAAKDKSQLSNFLREKLRSIIKTLKLGECLEYNPSVDVFNQGVENFFRYFDKWEQRNGKSNRYKTEDIGSGEYLCEIRLLPCLLQNVEATNIGPLGSQIAKYWDTLTLAIAKDMLNIRDNKNPVDKNLISHILKIRFGETNLLFGGDTHKDIWEECLTKYQNPMYQFAKTHGNLDSRFIKVSHHGSKNSSSPLIWEKIISDSGQVYLGISAGRHNGYKHPHSETLREIRECRNDANILSTNICVGCLREGDVQIEYHKWYDDYIKRNKFYLKDKPNDADTEINENFSKTTTGTREESQDAPMGLFAYVIEIPSNLSEEINVRMALSKVKKSHECFFKKHQEKLFDCCNASIKS